MHSALGLVEERERRPKEEMDRLRRLLFGNTHAWKSAWGQQNGMLNPPSLARQGSRSAWTVLAGISLLRCRLASADCITEVQQAVNAEAIKAGIP